MSKQERIEAEAILIEEIKKAKQNIIDVNIKLKKEYGNKKDSYYY